nr:PREDICTED: protein nessun dorma isoform X1 [Bemisia tabaci]
MHTSRSSSFEIMAPSLITFNKSHEKRLEEYKEILGSQLPPSQVFEQWCDYLDLGVEPTGWCGLWNISRELCEDFDIPFPCPVFVLVELVNFKELTAQVRVNRVMHEVSLPEVISDVPLLNLYPTSEQENSALNVEFTAECIDQYRLFYNHLWWPWDLEEIGEISDWVSVHLEMRLQLYFDMLSGEMDYEIGSKIRHYITSGKDIYEEIKELEEIINEEDVAAKMTESEALLLTKRAELDQIKTKLLLFENKDFRLIESRKKQKARASKKSAETTVVLSTCSSQDAVSYMNEFGKNFSDTNKIVQFCSDPQEAVMKALPGDTIVISPGFFKLNSSGAIEEGGSIIGMIPDNKPVLSDLISNWSLLEFCSNARLMNVAIEIQQVHSGIIVRRNSLTLQDVSMKALSSLQHQAIVVLKNGVLEANNCTFSGFDVALVANEGATVVINSCTFEDNNFAIKLCEGATVTLNNCSVYASKNCAIQIESGKVVSQISSMELLHTIPGVKAVGLTIQNSSKGDVQVVKRRTGIILEDNM